MYSKGEEENGEENCVRVDASCCYRGRTVVMLLLMIPQPQNHLRRRMRAGAKPVLGTHAEAAQGRSEVKMKRVVVVIIAEVTARVDVVASLPLSVSLGARV